MTWGGQHFAVSIREETREALFESGTGGCPVVMAALGGASALATASAAARWPAPPRRARRGRRANFARTDALVAAGADAIQHDDRRRLLPRALHGRVHGGAGRRRRDELERP